MRAGFYFSGERAEIDNHELVFPADPDGTQTSDVPLPAIVDDRAITAWLYGVYIQDEWRPTEAAHDQLWLAVRPLRRYRARRPGQPTSGHGLQTVQEDDASTPPTRAISRRRPTELIAVEAVNKFANTTGAPASPFSSNPSPERSHYFDVGAIQELLPGLNVGIDAYFKMSTDLIDEGQFGPAIIFSTFNYSKGRNYGAEFTGSYNHENLTTYANFAYSVAQGEKVESGQFNFSPDELAYISQPLHLPGPRSDLYLVGGRGLSMARVQLSV